MVLTEDLGKIAEMAVCLRFDTPYQGNFRYEMARAEALVPRLETLPTLFPLCRHTARRGARYDFTGVDDETKHLSVKTSKRRVAKVAPQLLGQATPVAFCERVGVPYTTDRELKEYMQSHILELLPALEEHTFDCPNLYYNEERNVMKFITRLKPLLWTERVPTWTCSAQDWNNSSTLKLDGVSILEVQFHSRSRKNLAIRWFYDAVLEMFSDNFHVQDL